MTDLRESFAILRKYRMKLNPAKCAFEVDSGKFFCSIVSERAIEASAEKISVILDMQPPQNTNEIQRLAARVAALNRFVSRSTDKCLPFFRVLRKVHSWNEKCDKALRS